jgi:alpha-beta hydrolase superfamily lysophospholipase
MTGSATRSAVLLIVGLSMLACSTPSDRPAPDPASVPRREWLPDGPPRAVVLALHGFNDYSSAFVDFGSYAASHGIAVFAYDQSGFGANPDAGRWPGIATLIGDLRRERARIARLYPDKPVYMLGESMGAAVVIAAVTSRAPLEAAGVIMTAPAIWGGDQLNSFYRAVLWIADHVAPGLKLTGESLGVLASDNLEMLRALGADPLFIKATRVDAIAGLVRLMDLAYANAPQLQGPLLVLGGARDEIVPPEAHVAMVGRLTAEPCTEVVYENGWHLLLRDLERKVVWDDILAWIDGQPLPSGLAKPCGGSLSLAAAKRE